MARSATSGATTSTVPSGQDVVLAADGLGVVTFGGEAGLVLTELATRLGPPTDDSPLSSCPRGEIDRVVQFAELSVLVATAGGVERFVAWDLGPPSGALPRLATAEGISVGASLDRLRVAYGTRLELLLGDPFGPGFEIEVASGDRLGGTLTGSGDTDTVATISAGSASCAA
ncbi:hypothetical protein BH23ACT1_BH23ACT1_15140 [soil metagenome]